MINIDEFISEMDLLPLNIKTQLIDKLLSSIHSTDDEIDRIWAAEAEKRLEEIKSGKVKTIPGDEVLDVILNRYK